MERSVAILQQLRKGNNNMELEKIQKIIADVLNVDPKEVELQTTFTEDLGADSLDLFQIVMQVEEVFNVEIDQEAMEGIQTVEDALNAIQKVIR